MWLHYLVRYAMIASLLLAAVAWWMKDTLPPAAGLSAELLEAPKQVKVSRKPVATRVNGIDYSIQPRYSYELNALVVSLHHSDTWWDYVHRQWNDHINLMDLCVVWGENVRNGAYRRISFSNDQWTCSFGASSSEAWSAFDMYEASNNHMVTDDPAIARALRDLRIGDQIRVRGYLVDYTVYKDGKPAGTRVSSEVRTDTGNGACEVLYVETLDLLGSANRGWRLAYKAALVLLLLSVIAWIALPVKYND
jgi:hypothetical protein